MSAIDNVQDSSFVLASSQRWVTSGYMCSSGLDADVMDSACKADVTCRWVLVRG